MVLLEELALPLGALRLDEARLRGDDDLGGVVYPDAGVAAVNGVRGEEVREGAGRVWGPGRRPLGTRIAHDPCTRSRARGPSG